ncbi:hypothetical protein K469DRAFT_682489 [Zopfia rhizophila CBS 207.26]|uniref:Uncharacterized protein n=1 Tax=Zopfia rhizophila CBS 207.26 TaxID=1314779 RepID=A0A6A6DDI7_9PEZI|nr:hypothetical protein K469DRAFT_682489 [Zopfia rhizophila CBS 207.26]
MCRSSSHPSPSGVEILLELDLTIFELARIGFELVAGPGAPVAAALIRARIIVGTVELLLLVLLQVVTCLVTGLVTPTQLRSDDNAVILFERLQRGRLVGLGFLDRERENCLNISGAISFSSPPFTGTSRLSLASRRMERNSWCSDSTAHATRANKQRRSMPTSFCISTLCHSAANWFDTSAVRTTYTTSRPLLHHRHPRAGVERPVQVRPQQHPVQRRLNLQVAALAHVGVPPLPLARRDQMRLLAEVHNARHTARLVAALEVLHVPPLRSEGGGGSIGRVEKAEGRSTSVSGTRQ